MKEMIYSKDRKVELLDKGTCCGFNCYILNLGTHPTAYVEIPKKHKYYQKNYNEIGDAIDVHGGLTYSENNLYIGENQEIEGWFIGWDYAHYNDYMGYFDSNMISLNNLKKWSTEEIREEVYEVCRQLLED